MAVFMTLNILLWILKKNLEWKKNEWENTSGIKATEKVGGHCLGSIPTSPAFDLISLSNDWWSLLTDSLRLGILEAPHASRPIMANKDSVKGGTYQKTGGFGQKQQCVSAGVNNKILKHPH